jgi:hypothetical protein
LACLKKDQASVKTILQRSQLHPHSVQLPLEMDLLSLEQSKIIHPRLTIRNMCKRSKRSRWSWKDRWLRITWAPIFNLRKPSSRMTTNCFSKNERRKWRERSIWLSVWENNFYCNRRTKKRKKSLKDTKTTNLNISFLLKEVRKLSLSRPWNTRPLKTWTKLL